MVQAWFMDPSCNQEQREDHKYNPNRSVTLDELKAKTGVDYFSIPSRKGEGEEYLEDPKLTQIKKERGYTYEDDITIQKEKLPNYEEKLKMFFEEHLHADEEIRYFLEGSGYFDVRDHNDDWIRIEMVAGDMIILPAGIYHRFTLDTKNYARVKRFFVGEPVWTPHNRPADSHPARLKYLKTLRSDEEECVKG